MYKNWHQIILILLALFSRGVTNAQELQNKNFDNEISVISSTLIDKTEKKYRDFSTKIEKQNEKMIAKVQRLEEKIFRKHFNTDSNKTNSLIMSSRQRYQQLTQKIKNSRLAKTSILKEYLPLSDSLQAGFSFIAERGATMFGVSDSELKRYTQLSEQIKQFQKSVSSVSDIKLFLKERSTFISQQLNLPANNRLIKKMKQDIFYFTRQWEEYKSMLNDPDKLMKHVMLALRENDEFKNFMASNSMIASLFQIPGNSPLNSNPIPGLQTISGTQQLLARNISTPGMNPSQFISQQTSVISQELNVWKDKLNSWGGGAEELEMPDFKPNTQRTKSLWKRMEWGLNFQSQRSRGFLPVTTDVAFTAGYKLSDKSTVGIGGGVKIGWGKDFRNIQLTGQGFCLRSFIDLKLKGNFWITGGFEKNYQQQFSRIEELKNMDAWQESGLIGLSKKYKIGKKSGNFQLLWDFLSYNQIPPSTPIKFRIGYSF
jgi:hypothetical protein